MYDHKSKILIDEDIITQVYLGIWNGGGKSVQALQTVEQTCLTYRIATI